jgi:hypothetical protein
MSAIDALNKIERYAKINKKHLRHLSMDCRLLHNAEVIGKYNGGYIQE